MNDTASPKPVEIVPLGSASSRRTRTPRWPRPAGLLHRRL